jgi:hypothetical protein
VRCGLSVGDSEVDLEDEFVEFFVESEELIGKVGLLLVLLLNLA